MMESDFILLKIWIASAPVVCLFLLLQTLDIWTSKKPEASNLPASVSAQLSPGVECVQRLCDKRVESEKCTQLKP